MKTENGNLNNQLIELKEEIKNLKADQKNKRLSAYSSIATPIIVAILGGYFAITQINKERVLNQDNLSVSTEIAEKNRWLEQAKFAKLLLDDFLNPDSARAKMALEITAHADPNLGSRLAEIISNSPNSKVQNFASNKKIELREILIRQLIHPEKDVRWNAAEGLLSYSKDANLIPNLIGFAMEDSEAKSKKGGENWRIYNVMTVLLDLARGKHRIIKDNKIKIAEFIDWAISNDSRVTNLANELKNRL